MYELVSILLINLTAVTILEIAGWLFSLKKKNVTIADSLWGAGFIIITWITFIQADGFLWRKLLVSGAVTIWGARLSLYITKRSAGKGEDPRYGEWRKKFGHRFPLVSLFRVFLVQALFMWLIALSVQIAQAGAQPESLTLLDITGLLIWLAGIIIETAADWQLSQFKKDPANRGKVMRYKLWKYSRHPNYFGESLIWWGIFLIACSTEYGIITIISPVLITYTLLNLTGVSLMEETRFKDNPEHLKYRKSTSSFIPWFPRK